MEMIEFKHYRRADGTYIGAFDHEHLADDAIECPAPPDGRARWVNGAWDMAPLLREQQEAARRIAYTQEADPIFFMAQRGEATMEEWTAKVAEIKARFPYPVEGVQA